MSNPYIVIDQCRPLQGEVTIAGAKNAVLVIMASLILTSGTSRLTNVPCSDDVYQMIILLESLGATVYFDTACRMLDIDTRSIQSYTVSPDIMRKIRASILVMGPLLARYGRAQVALPGGDLIGSRPIDLHLKAFMQMGAYIEQKAEFLTAHASSLQPYRCVLEYPSVGATENILMAAVLIPGTTRIVNAAIEPEVLDLITVLRKMGAHIDIQPPALLEVQGVTELYPIEHEIMPDRLEAGTLLLAAAITGGNIRIPQAPAYALDVFLEKLAEMGHSVVQDDNGKGVRFTATRSPKAVSFKTMPYPGFPTDLQAPMMAAQCIASGTSIIHETVFENRLIHVRELQKMGAQITVEGTTASIKGVDELYGAHVIATDIRASAGLIIAGLAAQGQTIMTGVHHLRRGYQDLEHKLTQLGAHITVKSE